MKRAVLLALSILFETVAAAQVGPRFLASGALCNASQINFLGGTCAVPTLTVAGGTVTSVTAAAPLASSGGAAPDISLTGTVSAARGGTGISGAGGTANRVLATADGSTWTATTVTALTCPTCLVMGTNNLTAGAVLRDTAGGLGGNLLAVQNSAGTIDHFYADAVGFGATSVAATAGAQLQDSPTMSLVGATWNGAASVDQTVTFQLDATDAAAGESALVLFFNSVDVGVRTLDDGVFLLTAAPSFGPKLVVRATPYAAGAPAAQGDSPEFTIRGSSSDGVAAYTADWAFQVDVTSNAGASDLYLRRTINSGAPLSTFIFGAAGGIAADEFNFIDDLVNQTGFTQAGDDTILFRVNGADSWQWASSGNVTVPTGDTLAFGANTLVSGDKLRANQLAIASQAVGDLLYADSTTSFSRLADVATGSVLVSGGAGVAPTYSGTPRVAGLGANAAAPATGIATTSIATTNLLASSTAPVIASGFGTSPSVSASNGTAAFRVTVGTGGSASSGEIGLPAASTGWNCWCTDVTTASATVFLCKQTASTTTTATVGNFDAAGAAAAWTASDVLAVSCFGY